MTGIETHSSIGMISGVSRLDDSAFLFSAWSGLKALNEEFGYNTTILESDEEQDTLMNARYLAHSNFDLMWAVGYGTQEAVEFIAPRFPKIPICTVDMSFDSVPPSVVSVRFDEHHGSFLAGVVAARASKTRTVGFVGGVRGELMDRFAQGFVQGVEYVGGVEARVEYCGSFISFQAGRNTAEAMYGEGCDVLFHAAGAAGRGVIRTAKDLGKMVIGVDRDQSFLAPRNVITSMLKRIDRAVV
ncbi:MAG: BMP family ABC transporter substrate-binding protein [Spirochaetales bacterium]|nr:BMP family ABC transporter substrate-binding protein [Spirochaetales bacterium]